MMKSGIIGIVLWAAIVGMAIYLFGATCSCSPRPIIRGEGLQFDGITTDTIQTLTLVKHSKGEN